MGAPAEQPLAIFSPQESPALAPLDEFPAQDIETSIPDRFEKIVRLYPDRLAVKMADQTFTYRELNRAANSIARAILDKCGARSEPVALLFEHGVDAIAAILGVLKAGKFYVALNTSAPFERNAQILEDCQPALILTHGCRADSAGTLANKRIALLDIEQVTTGFSDTSPELEVSPGSAAVLVYTSGSTGTPKGVLEPHRNMLHSVMVQTHSRRIIAADRLSLLHSLSFGSSKVQLFTALLNGATLLPFDLRTNSIEQFVRWLTEERITIYHSPPAAFRQLAQALFSREQLPSLRMMYLSGVGATKDDFDLYKKHFGPHTLLEIGMGSTETNQISLCLAGQNTPFPQTGTPAGYPVSGKQILILDDDGRVVPRGEIGEIAVRSRYLSVGYWRRPELTRDKFRSDPDGSHERTYLTGDLGRLLPDGFLIHLGRKDLMVKIRGFRVEIGEIERALLSHPWVKDAGVAAWERAPAEKYLVGYVVAHAPGVFTTSELRAFLLERLPDYMVPLTFVFLASLPMTNGKLDRRALPEPDHLRPQLKTRYVAPHSELEKQLVELWEAILDVCPVGVDDDFFDLGGYSLLGAKLIEEIKERHHVELPLRLLAEQPTIAQLAARIETIQSVEAKPRKQDQSYKYLVKLQSAQGTTPVFCLSHAGNYRGDLLRFAQLNRLVGPPYCFYGIQARGADGLSQPHSSVAAMAAAYVEEIRAVAPRGPYYLIGECGAAPIAYETAQQLQASSDRVALLVLLDAKGFDRKTQRYFWRSYVWHRYFPSLSYLIHRAVQSQSLQSLRRSAGLRFPELCVLQGKEKLRHALLNSPRLIQLVCAQLMRRPTAPFAHNDRTQARYSAHARTRYPLYRMARLRYKYRPYSGKVAVIANEAWRKADPNLGWRESAVGGLEIHTIPGNHETYITKNIGTVANVLADCLERAETGRRA